MRGLYIIPLNFPSQLLGQESLQKLKGGSVGVESATPTAESNSNPDKFIP